MTSIEDLLEWLEYHLDRRVSRIGEVLLVDALLPLRMFAERDLWNWFVSPLGAPAVSFEQVIGVNLLALLLLRRTKPWSMNFLFDSLRLKDVLWGWVALGIIWGSGALLAHLGSPVMP